MSKKPPQIRIPATGNLRRPFAGLIASKGIWYAWYYEGKRRVRKSMGTDNIADARKERDKLYHQLRKQGAVTANSAGRAAVSRDARKKVVQRDPGGNQYIRERKPFIVVVGKKVIAECDTEAEAREARNKHFGIKTENTK